MLFDDFADLLPRLLASKGLAVFTRFCDLLGIRLKSAKSEVGPAVAFLGLLGAFPARGADFALWICRPVGKKKKRDRAARVAPYLDQNRIAFHGQEKLICRMPFSKTLLLGKFERSEIRPLYQKLYRGVYNSSLSDDERATFFWRYGAIVAFTPRIVRPLSREFDWPVYTGAASKPPCLCALRFNPTQASIRLGKQLVAFARPWTHLFKATCLIYGLELPPLPLSLRIAARGWLGDLYGSTWAVIIVYRLLPGATPIPKPSPSWSAVCGLL